jgi:hypothetical protein
MTTPSKANAWGLTEPRETTLPWARAGGLATPRATAICPTTACGTSVSYIHFDLNVSTQTHPHTRVGSPTALENRN